MPTVLITGLNGFVAVHVALKFLAEGWHVRGTVRLTARGEEVLALPCFADHAGKVSFAVVDDLVNGDCTQALEGVEAIAHIASPSTLYGASWDFYKGPSVDGTANLIRQAAKAPNVKAVAAMSSFLAVVDCNKPFAELAGRTYTEADWMPYDETDCLVEPDKADFHVPTLWYCVSKKLAEQTAIRVTEELGSPFALSTLCPPLMYGPAYNHATAADLAQVDVSTLLMHATLIAGKDKTVPPTTFPGWADARDVSTAFFQALSQRRTGRYLIAGGVTDFDTFASIAAELRPDLEAAGVIPQHLKDGGPVSKGCYQIDTTKARQELGITFSPMRQMVKDTLDHFEQLGAIKV